MDGCVSVGGVKIDDSVSYNAAACWAGVIDNEIHVISFRSGRTEDTQKGPQRLRCCEDARTPCDGVSIELNIRDFVLHFVDTFGSDFQKLSTGYPQP
jgi:hypothetical protein